MVRQYRCFVMELSLFHEAMSQEPRGVSGTKGFKATSRATAKRCGSAKFTYMGTQDSGLIIFDVQGWLY